ncbi:MAG: hypothetical protein KAH18_07405 [Psychromonas sp.]|nr:hypothetical protein [Psychromonas sp.]
MFDDAEHIILTEKPDDIGRVFDDVENDTQEKILKKHTKRGEVYYHASFLV